MKKKLIIIFSVILAVVAIAVLTIGIIRYKQVKKGIYGAVETTHMGYHKYTPSLPENYDGTDEYRVRLLEQVDYQCEMKNLHIKKKVKEDPEIFNQIFKDGYDASFEVSKAVGYVIEVDVREKYDYDENNSIITEEYKAWNENHIDNNHNWSEWHTEEHIIESIKIDGKWYYKCMDDED